jgi:signal transduction histidine kinase
MIDVYRFVLALCVVQGHLLGSGAPWLAWQAVFSFYVLSGFLMTLILNETSCDLRQLADGVLAAARMRAPEAVDLALRAPDTLPPARCDEDKLRQVLVNLVENAIKYSPDGGEVTVELAAHDSLVQIDVHDRGLGIPPSDQERVFEKFVRLDPALSRGVGGSGLGLYITRELIERMGGTISVESEPGAGSRFSVKLPAA